MRNYSQARLPLTSHFQLMCGHSCPEFNAKIFLTERNVYLNAVLDSPVPKTI